MLESPSFQHSLKSRVRPRSESIPDPSALDEVGRKTGRAVPPSYKCTKNIIVFCSAVVPADHCAPARSRAGVVAGGYERLGVDFRSPSTAVRFIPQSRSQIRGACRRLQAEVYRGVAKRAVRVCAARGEAATLIHDSAYDRILSGSKGRRQLHGSGPLDVDCEEVVWKGEGCSEVHAVGNENLRISVGAERHPWHATLHVSSLLSCASCSSR